MKNIVSILQNSILFSNSTKDDIDVFLKTNHHHISSYQKDEYICRAGDKITHIGILLSGSAHIISEDFWGNRNILAHLIPSDLFAETFALSGLLMTVNVVANEPSEILWIDAKNLMATNQHVLQNMLKLLAGKNLMLTKKMEHLSRRTTREKILSYLSNISSLQGKSQIAIPFNRQELADYLCVDRSALSNELSKLQKEGLLSYHKNQFILHEKSQMN